MHGRRHGFTLVELLVVIGIIAVLVGILLPALNASRAQARSVACMNNVRQVATAVLAYADTNKTRLPYNYFQGNNGQLTWNGIGLLVSTKALAIPTFNDVYTSDVLLCPADDSGVDAGYANGPAVAARFRNSNAPNPPTFNVIVSYGACPRLLAIPDGINPLNSGTTASTETMKVRTHYTLNGTHPGYAPGGFAPQYPGVVQLPNSTPGNRRPPLRITQCRKPTDSWIVFENANCDIVPGNMVFRHPHLSANFGYLDGHVENLKTGDVDGNVEFGAYTGVGLDSRTNLVK
jgi:prepilin-type N-terminal cleavage/methylation domain-containing protein/prepilin-type processing-associated H-X9-DG protein